MQGTQMQVPCSWAAAATPTAAAWAAAGAAGVGYAGARAAGLVTTAKAVTEGVAAVNVVLVRVVLASERFMTVASAIDATALARWARRVRHVSLDRGSWERNEPWALTIPTRAARIAIDHVRSACSGGAFEECAAMRLLMGSPSPNTRSPSMDPISLLTRLIKWETDPITRLQIPIDRDAMNWIIDALLRHDPLLMSRTSYAGHWVPFASPSLFSFAMICGEHWVGPFMDHGADVNNVQIERIGTIHRLMDVLSIGDFKTLLAQSNDTTLNESSFLGKTPLMRAASTSLALEPHHRQVLRLLLDRVHGDGSGVNIDAVDKSGDDAESMGLECARKLSAEFFFYRMLQLGSAFENMLTSEFGATRRRIFRWRCGIGAVLVDALLVPLQTRPLVELVQGFVVPPPSVALCRFVIDEALSAVLKLKPVVQLVQTLLAPPPPNDDASAPPPNDHNTSRPCS